MRRIASVALLLSQGAIASAQIPIDFFGGLTLDEPLPTNFTTGEAVSVSGTVTNPNILAISLEFSSPDRIVEHRIRVVRGRFEHPVLFTHEEIGTYTLRVVFVPLIGDPIVSRPAEPVGVQGGSGDIIFPPSYLENWLDPARFVPHAIESSDDLLPPFYVRTGGSPTVVFVVISNDSGPNIEYEVFDDGLDADLIAGDGIYTLAPGPIAPGIISEFRTSTEGGFGKIDAVAIVQYREGFRGFATQCGVVDGALSHITPLDSGVQRTEFVLNIVEPDILIFRGEPGVDVWRAGRRFYEYFRDDYDFLVVRSALRLANGLHGSNTRVKNDIHGIGLEIFDNTAEFGSAGRLRGVTVINFKHIGPLVHEVAHNWANYLERFESEKYGAHWGFTNVQGVLGGHATRFEELRTDRYAVSDGALSSFWGGRYSPLELYLMGLLPASEVPPHYVLGNSRILEVDDAANAIIVSGSLEQVTIEEIIAEEGPRIPGSEESQKSFRMGTIVVSDRPLTPVEITYMDRQTAFFGSDVDDPLAFAAATGFRATMETRLDRSITAILDSGPDEEDPSPSAIGLSQNYPNPFNSSTTFLVELDGSAASLEIFAVNGQLVRRLEIAGASAGVRSLTWDGLDSSGREAGTGTYVAVLVGQKDARGRLSVARKLTLLR